MLALDLAACTNRAWVALYTAGLTPLQQRNRKDEVASDLYEHRTLYVAAGVSGATVARQMTSRLVRGALADVLWRMEAGRAGEAVAGRGESPPLPFLTMCFVAGVIAFGGTTTVMQGSLLDLGLIGASLAGVAGAGLLWWGLYLASHRAVGPIFVAGGTALMAWGFWWTIVIPIGAVAAGVAGVRRAQRIERLIDA